MKWVRRRRILVHGACGESWPCLNLYKWQRIVPPEPVYQCHFPNLPKRRSVNWLLDTWKKRMKSSKLATKNVKMPLKTMSFKNLGTRPENHGFSSWHRPFIAQTLGLWTTSEKNTADPGASASVWLISSQCRLFWTGLPPPYEHVRPICSKNFCKIITRHLQSAKREESTGKKKEQKVHHRQV